MKKFLLFGFTFWLAALAAQAQESWVPRVSGLSAGTALWGVAYGGGQWVAVGELGTILTSPDGITWTKRNSGFPTRWLVGVGYGNGLWVAVGGTASITENNGLILTSTDGITWTPRITSGTRINNVVYGNGTFVAVDDAGGRWTSLDGITGWSRGFTSTGNYLRGLVLGAPQFVTTGLNGIQTSFDGISWNNRAFTAGQLEAAAYGRKQFVIAGANGTTYTSRDGLTWQQSFPTSTITFRGAAFFNNQFIAVGNATANGHGIASSLDGIAWVDRATNLEAGAILLAVAAGPDSAIAVGQNGAILQSPVAANQPSILTQPAAVVEAQGGNVAFTVSSLGSLPLVYQWRKDGVALDGANTDKLFLPTVQAAQAGNYSCVVTNAFGAAVSVDAALTVLDTFPPANPVDATFTLASALSTSPRVAATQPNGKILLGGNFLFLNQGQAQYGLARLNPDGSLDPTFKSGTLDPGSTVESLAVQADGRVLAGGNFTSVNGVARRGLARFNVDGSLDATFTLPSAVTLAVIQVAVAPDGRVLVLSNGSLLRFNPDGSADSTFAASIAARRFYLQPDGKILTASAVGIDLLDGVNRLNADGTADTSFTPISLILGRNTIIALQAQPDGRIMLAATPSPSSTGVLVQRFGANGNSDPSFRAYSAPSGSITTASFAADGRTWLGGSFTSLTGVPRNQLARLNVDGTLDATYNTGSGLTNAGGVSVAPNSLLALDDGRALVTGDFTRINGVARSQVALLSAQSFGGANAPQLLSIDPLYVEARAGVPFSVQLVGTGSAQLRYSFGGASAGTATGDAPSIGTVVNPQFTGVYSGNVTNSVGTSISASIFVRIVPSAPVITAQPAALQTNTGRPITLTVVSGGSGPLSYQWFKNDTLLTGATGATGASYSVAKSTVADSGDYTVVVRNNLGFATSQTVHVGIDETARIINLATRANTQSSASPLILGFTIQGLGNKRVTIRAVGPSLEQFGVPGFLVDPLLRVYNAAGALVYSNDNWNQSNDVPGIASSQLRLGAFSLNDVSKDAAGILTLTPGSYTAVITGAPVNGVETSGVALGEIYEDDAQSARLVNLSSRGFVSPGASIMIPGFVTTTTATQAPKKFLIRGIGPALQQFGVANSLLNPTLSVVDSAGKTVATNDDWEQNANLAELRAVTTQQAFPLAAGSKDAALLVSLVPGQYTCLVSGVANTSGTALVEIYEVP